PPALPDWSLRRGRRRSAAPRPARARPPGDRRRWASAALRAAHAGFLRQQPARGGDDGPPAGGLDPPLDLLASLRPLLLHAAAHADRLAHQVRLPHLESLGARETVRYH